MQVSNVSADSRLLCEPMFYEGQAEDSTGELSWFRLLFSSARLASIKLSFAFS